MSALDNLNWLADTDPVVIAEQSPIPITPAEVVAAQLEARLILARFRAEYDDEVAA